MGQTKARWVGSRLNIYNGPIELTTGSYVVDENIYLSTAGATLKNYGFQTINTSQVATLPAPEDGCRTDLLFYGTTKKMCVKTTGLLFNRQATQDVMHVALTSDMSQTGYPVTLRGEGTTGWWLLADNLQSSSSALKRFQITASTTHPAL
jgi:hypothetical protein